MRDPLPNRWITQAIGALLVCLVTLPTPTQATTLKEVSSWGETVFDIAIRLSIDTEAYRVATHKMTNPADCLFNNLAKINGDLKKTFFSERAKDDATYGDQLAEEIIARAILMACFNKKLNEPPGSYKMLMVGEFYKEVPDNVGKLHVLSLAIGTQAAIDLLNKEIDVLHNGGDRGQCIISEFLTGTKAPGLIELASTFRNNSDSIRVTVESIIIDLVNKHCGHDAYDSFVATDKVVTDVLKKHEAVLDKKIKEEEATLAEMCRHAYRLPDGRMILRDRDEDPNKWFFNDNSVVPANLAEQRIAPPLEGWSEVGSWCY